MSLVRATPRNTALAKGAYDAYGDEVEWKNYLGMPMPTWDALPAETKLAWVAGAIKVRELVYAEMMRRLDEEITQSWKLPVRMVMLACGHQIRDESFYYGEGNVACMQCSGKVTKIVKIEVAS